MMTLEELHAHYKSVRERLNNTPPKKPQIVSVYTPPPEKPKLEPEPLPPQEPAFSVIETPLQMILREVAHKHKMTVQNLKSASRTKEYVEARQEAAYRIQKELKFSLTQIGRVLGKRDHTTILHAIKQYEKVLAKGCPEARKSGVTDESKEEASLLS